MAKTARSTFRGQAVRNFLILCAWSVTSFLCHYTAKQFLTLLAHSTLTEHTRSDFNTENVLTRLMHAVLLTSIQLAMCASCLSLTRQDKVGHDTNERMAKLCHALATLATNVSMAFTFASSTFAIKVMEPITSALIQYLLIGTPLSPLAVCSLPLIVGGAIVFADMSSVLSSASLGIAAALMSNVLLAFRNIAYKQLTTTHQAKRDDTPSPGAPHHKAPSHHRAASGALYHNVAPSTSVALSEAPVLHPTTHNGASHSSRALYGTSHSTPSPAPSLLTPRLHLRPQGMVISLLVFLGVFIDLTTTTTTTTTTTLGGTTPSPPSRTLMASWFWWSRSNSLVLLLLPIQTYVLVSGLFHVTYSYISTGLVLTKMSVVSHAVVNILKRLSVIGLLHATGHRQADLHNLLGLVTCTLGLALYAWDTSTRRRRRGETSSNRATHGGHNNQGSPAGSRRISCPRLLLSSARLLLSSARLLPLSLRRPWSPRLLKAVWLSMLCGCIVTMSVYGTPPGKVFVRHAAATSSFYIQDSNPGPPQESLHPHPTLRSSFGHRGWERPDEEELMSGVGQRSVRELSADSTNSKKKENYNVTDFLKLRLNRQPRMANLLSRELTTSDEIIRESQRLHFNILGDELRQFKYAMLFDISAFENKGDPCITVGEVYFLARMNLKLVYYCEHTSCTSKSLAIAAARASKYKPEDLVILVQGGGNIVIYKENDILRFKLIRLFSARFRIFVFPQSVWVRDPFSPHVNRTVENYCCNQNLTFVLRDSLSYARARAMYKGTTRLLMAPDMAFQIGPVSRFMSPVFDVLWIKRRDKESPTYEVPENNNDDVIQPDLKVHVADWWGWKTPASTGSVLEKSFYIASNGFFFLQRGRVVITDRLHGHILATLMDIPHVLIDNRAKKLSSYHDTWTASLDNVLITNDSREALGLAMTLLKKYNATLPPRVPFLDLRLQLQQEESAQSSLPLTFPELGLPDTKKAAAYP